MRLREYLGGGEIFQILLQVSPFKAGYDVSRGVYLVSFWGWGRVTRDQGLEVWQGGKGWLAAPNVSHKQPVSPKRVYTRRVLQPSVFRESFSLNTNSVLPCGQKCSFAFPAGLHPRLQTHTVLLDPPAGSRKTPKDSFKPLPTATVLHLPRTPATTTKPRALGWNPYWEKSRRPTHLSAACSPRVLTGADAT